MHDRSADIAVQAVVHRVAVVQSHQRRFGICNCRRSNSLPLKYVDANADEAIAALEILEPCVPRV